MTRPNWSSIFSTFDASLRSVGTAVTLAAVGVYLHRRKFVSSEGKRTLAKISQQVTIPLFLFTKVVYCNQNWSTEPCPDVTKSLADVWLLLFWPIVVVCVGFLVGYGAAIVSRTPKEHFRSVLAVCGFGNSTGLPITLLTVVHANFPETSDLGHIDPTLFLSVYLILYPVIQWGLGGWLLAPQGDDDDDDKEGEAFAKYAPKGSAELGVKLEHDTEQTETEAHKDNDNTPLSPSLAFAHLKMVGERFSYNRNVLNNKEKELWYKHSRNAIGETDASLYISDADLVGLGSRYGASPDLPTLPPMDAAGVVDDSASNGNYIDGYQARGYQTLLGRSHGTILSPIPDDRKSTATQSTPLNEARADTDETTRLLDNCNGSTGQDHYNNINGSRRSIALRKSTPTQDEGETLCETCRKVMSRCLQPPVIGALAGIFVASTPLRGIFVDIIDRGSDAPLQFFFDGLYAVGLAAVPINMIILGCNLSASQLSIQQQQSKVEGGVLEVSNGDTGDNLSSPSLLSKDTMIAIVIGKMLVMPLIGVGLALLLEKYVLDIPKDIDGAFYLVLMIVFITPTANNVMVMVELSGSDTKEGIAQVIAWQYACAPVMLSITMSLVVGIASRWDQNR